MKSEKPINWSFIKIGVPIISIAIIIGWIVFSTISSRIERSQKKQQEYKKQEQLKLSEIVSKKYDIVCEKNIIKSSKYKVIKIKNNYKISVGDITNIEKAYHIGNCNVIYNINSVE